ncbi:LysM peptidoglycan-binding domain-containing protein [Maliponia aquimaris]|uniref:LysM domain/BON superfamily protein n=1 Tax=Maliponia aquimaris TaxID=1673631 RepID=A0A238K9C4_9RHOB|nr:LysM peptidoglycan-binding domain-containing protein [Maliponia aquimaris]SMX39488.1 LysM domain/BON superfamily protein [Maliponia aquimaris]
MIRMILLSIAFLGMTAVLIIYQPGAQQIRNRLDADNALAVTRAAGGPDGMPPQSAAEADPRDAAVPAHLLSAAQDGTVPMAGDPLPALTAAVRAAQVARDGGPVQPPAAQRVTPELTPGAAQDDPLWAMTETVLSTLGASTPRAATLQALVVEALREGQSDAYVDALLNEARQTGSIVVPAALITSDGKVDTGTLLAVLVQRSVGPAAPAPPPKAAAPGAPSRRVYTVQPGDSLAAISYRFYGETIHHKDIFEANRDKIDAPDQIRTGVTLTIPHL